MIESFENMEALLKETDLYNGRTVWLEEEQKTMIYDEESHSWIEEEPSEIKSVSGNIEMNLYELNRNIISQLPDFTDLAWDGAKAVINDWLQTLSCSYLLLYGRELNYFTLFKKENENAEFENFFEALKECLKGVGIVKSVEPEGKAIEIWVKELESDMISCLYLFNYDDGVVTYNG